MVDDNRHHGRKLLGHPARSRMQELLLLFDIILHISRYLNWELSSGAPPVMSTVVTELPACFKRSMHRSAVTLSIISVLIGELSTWQ